MLSKKTKIEHKNNFLIIFGKTFFVCVVVAVFFLGMTYGVRFYRETFREIITLEKINNVELKEAVVVNFSVPVWRTDYASGVVISPKENVQVKFDAQKRKLTLTPEKNWQPGTKYTVYFPAGKSAMLTDIAPMRMSFSTVPFPQVATVVPADGEKAALVGAEDPIVVNFKKSVQGYFIKFALEPEAEIIYQINPEKTQFKILPKIKIEDGIKYNLTISAKVFDAPDVTYRQIYAQSFETLPALPVVWEKDFALRLEQAKRYTKAKITSGKYIDVNLATQIMATFSDGTLLDAYLISSGKRGMDTPTGTHQIYNKAPRAYSKAYSLYMPNWMAIVPDGKFGIHELPEWPGGYKEGANHLGTPVSHGCMRLGVGSAKSVYDWAEIGTPVIVY